MKLTSLLVAFIWVAAGWGLISAEAATNDKNCNVPALKPGQWVPLFELEENLFPSLVIATATLHGDEGDEKEDPWRKGDFWGMIGVAVCPPADKCQVKVEITGSNFVRSGSFSGELPKGNSTYTIFPTLKYDYDKLLTVKQVVPEDLTFKVTIGGQPVAEKVVRVNVHPINECVFAYVDVNGVYNDVAWMFAAYVNENHPIIDDLLQEALSSGMVDSFAGYGKESDGVLEEINAIWETLQKKGFRYSSITTGANGSEWVNSQHVRLFGESLKHKQANCVDGSVMLASILRKIGLNVSLVVMPEHMMVAVDLDEKGDRTIFIETTLMGKHTLKDAMESGQEDFEKVAKRFESDKKEDWDYQIVNIAEARTLGIMPLKDASAK